MTLRGWAGGPSGGGRSKEGPCSPPPALEAASPRPPPRQRDCFLLRQRGGDRVEPSLACTRLRSAPVALRGGMQTPCTKIQDPSYV